MSFAITLVAAVLVVSSFTMFFFSLCSSADMADEMADSAPMRVVCTCGAVQAGPHQKWVNPIQFQPLPNDSHGICPECKSKYLADLELLKPKQP